MKTKLLFVCLTGILLTCCKKEQSVFDQVADPIQMRTESVAISNSNSIFSHLIRPDENADNDINYGLFLSALTSLDMLGNQSFEQALRTKTNFNDLNEAKLEDLIRLSPSGMLSFESALSTISAQTSLGHIPSWTSLLDLMIHPTGAYYPVIYYHNAHSNPEGDGYIIAVGDQVLEEDKIPAWLVDENGTVTEILLAEDDEFDVPILIFSNGTDDTWDTEENPATPTVQSNHDVDSYRITSRYENDNHSEYRLASQTVTYNVWSPSQGVQHLASIHKNSIGQTFTGDIPIIFTHPVYGHVVGGAKTCTYEHDWYATGKKVFISGTPGHLLPKMKYNNEWYQKVYLDIANGPSTVTVNSKGHITYKNL